MPAGGFATGRYFYAAPVYFGVLDIGVVEPRRRSRLSHSDRPRLDAAGTHQLVSRVGYNARSRMGRKTAPPELAGGGGHRIFTFSVLSN